MTSNTSWTDRCILGFFPHPDDEAYAAGGTLALCARGGARVTVACATRGERGEDFLTGLRPGDELARLRTRELESSCRILGAGPPVFLDLPDGRVAGVDHAGCAERIRDLILHERPHVVVTLGRDGAYGHVDHIACTGLLDAAVRGLPEEAKPRVLQAAFPPGLFRPVWRSLRLSPARRLVADLDPETIGIDEGRVDLVVDIAAVRERKLAAIAAHRSQLPDGDPGSFLAPGLVERLLDLERFTVASGTPLPEGATDPFADL